MIMRIKTRRIPSLQRVVVCKQTTYQCVKFLRMKINKDLFSALKFDILQISCVLKIRLGGERSEHAISLLTDGPPSPILTLTSANSASRSG